MTNYIADCLFVRELLLSLSIFFYFIYYCFYYTFLRWAMGEFDL